jgi:Activator of Hsp90 ATPase homolog 1-like protein
MSAAARTVVQPVAEEAVRTFSITREDRIEASIEIVFEAILEQMGPLNEKPGGEKMPMRLEVVPGGRWYRDLGQTGGHPAGHLWGHVQAIKAPELLEIYGPLFMSFPATSNVQYRLTADGDSTRLRFAHVAMGLIPDELSANVSTGWDDLLGRIRAAAEARKTR